MVGQPFDCAQGRPHPTAHNEAVIRISSKRKESAYLVIIFRLTDYNWFVFYEGTTVAGIPLNDEKFGMLYGNHIRPLIRKIIGITLIQRSTYVCMKKGCYTDSRALVGSYLETIYTLLAFSACQ